MWGVKPHNNNLIKEHKSSIEILQNDALQNLNNLINLLLTHRYDA